MGMLLLEKERLQQLKAPGGMSERGGEPWVQARTTDRLRFLEMTCQGWNIAVLEHRLRTARGRQNLIGQLRELIPCHVP